MASRLIWFGIGFFAGSAYASRLISKERLDLPPGTDTTHHLKAIKTEKKENPKLKAATMIEEKSRQLAEIIDRQSVKLAAMVQERGDQLAGKLRGEKAPTAQGDVLVTDTASAYPVYGSPTSAQEQMAATYGTGSEVGLEENR